MKTYLQKLSLFAALVAVPLGALAELPEWPTPDFLPKDVDVYPVFVKYGANPSNTGADWFSDATPDLSLTDPVDWSMSPYWDPSNPVIPEYVQVIVSTGLWFDQSGQPTASLAIPSEVTLLIPEGEPVVVPVVAIRGGYYDDDNATCASDEVVIKRYDTRQVANPVLSRLRESNGDLAEPAENVAEVLGITGTNNESILNDLINGTTSLPLNNAKATVFDGETPSSINLRNVLDINPGDYPEGLLLDNIVVSRGEATFVSGNPETKDVYGGGLYIQTTTDSVPLHLHGLTFYNNIATQRGGGIYVERQSGIDLNKTRLKVSYSAFIDNDAEEEGGGAIWNQIPSLTVVQSVFDSNSASQGQGGAIYTNAEVFQEWDQGSSLNNYLLYEYQDGDPAEGVFFVSNVFFGNRCGQQGGAAYAANDSRSAWINNTFVSNHAQQDGAAMNLAPFAEILTIQPRTTTQFSSPFATSGPSGLHGFYNNLFVANTEDDDYDQSVQVRHNGEAFESVNTPDIAAIADFTAYVQGGAVAVVDFGQNNSVRVVDDSTAAADLTGYMHYDPESLSKTFARADLARGDDGALGTYDDTLQLAGDSSLVDTGDNNILIYLSHMPYLPNGVEGRYYAGPVGSSSGSSTPPSWHRNYWWGYGPEARQIVDVFFYDNFDNALFNDVSNYISGDDITVTGDYNIFWRYGLDVITHIPEGKVVEETPEEPGDLDCPVSRLMVQYEGVSFFERNLSFRVRASDNDAPEYVVDVGAYERRPEVEGWKTDVIDCSVIYVDDNAPGDENGVHDGSTWRSAYLFIQDAILRAQLDPQVEVIRVAQGENGYRNYTTYSETINRPVWQVAFDAGVDYNPGRASGLYVNLAPYAEWDLVDIAEMVAETLPTEYTESELQAAVIEYVANTGVHIPATLDARTSEVFVTGCIDNNTVQTAPIKGTPYPFPSYFSRDRYEEYREGVFSDQSQTGIIDNVDQTYVRARGPWTRDTYMRSLVAFRVEQPIIVDGIVYDAFLDSVDGNVSALTYSEHPDYRYNLNRRNGNDHIQLHGGYRGWDHEVALGNSFFNSRQPGVMSPYGISTMLRPPWSGLPSPSTASPFVAWLRFPYADNATWVPALTDGDLRTRDGNLGNVYDRETVTTGWINRDVAAENFGDGAVGAPGSVVYSRRIFQMEGNWDVELEGLTIEHAGIQQQVGDGAGIALYSPANLTIHFVTVQDNESAETGGGIFSNGGDLYVWNSIVRDNESGDQGGGIWLDDAALWMWNSLVENNTTGMEGGGIYLEDALSDIRNSVVQLNSATEVESTGGGLHSEESTVWVDYSRSYFTGRDCPNLLAEGRFDIPYGISVPGWAEELCYYEDWVCSPGSNPIQIEGEKSLFHANTAYFAGGGIFIDEDSVISLNNTTVQYNQVFNDRYGFDQNGDFFENGVGGGLAVFGDEGRDDEDALPLAWVHNANFIANTASYGAGAYVDRAFAFQVDRSIFLSNWARWAGGAINIQDDQLSQVAFNEEDRAYWMNQTMIVGNRAAPQYGVWDDSDRPYAGGIYSLNAALWVENSVFHQNSAPYGPAWVDDIDIVTFPDAGEDIRDGRNPNFAPYVARMIVFNSIIHENRWYNRTTSFVPVKQIGGYILYDGENIYDPGNDSGYDMVGDPRDRLESNPELGIIWSLIPDDGFYYGDPEGGDSNVMGDPQFDDVNTMEGPRGFYFFDFHNPAYNDPMTGELAGFYMDVDAGKGDDMKYGTMDDALGFMVEGGLAELGTCDFFGNITRHMGIYPEFPDWDHAEPLNLIRILWLEPLENGWYWSYGLEDYVYIPSVAEDREYTDFYSQTYGWYRVQSDWETGNNTYWMYSYGSDTYYWLSNHWGPEAAYNLTTDSWGQLPPQ